MNARFLLIAAASLATTSAVSAEPRKAPAKTAAHPAKSPAPIMMASAEQVPVPSPTDQTAQAPVKRPRTARVTTCRCGDQVAEEQPEQ